MKRILLFALLLGVVQSIQAQSFNVKGMVVDQSNGDAISGATVLLVNVKDSTMSRFGVTDEQGQFHISKAERAFYRLKVASMGYKPYSRIVRIAVDNFDFGAISLEVDTRVLQNVDVLGEVVPMEQKGDTLLYNAEAFKVNPDASTIDLVSKMPGIVVDESGVSSNGEQIEQVLLDGKRFFGQDPLLSLNTIPAEVVNTIEIFDQMSERSQLTGFDDGNTTKTMNVVTYEDKRNGVFGKTYGGYGTDERYSAGATVNKFNKDTRLTFLGMSNNINQQNFSSEDLAGVGMAGRGGGRRAGVRSALPGGGSNNFLTGTQNGITRTNAAGLNFSDEFGEKATFEGSYFFNDTRNSNNQQTNREIFRESGSQYYNEVSESTTDNMNHRLNMRITYNMNENNKLIYRPTVSFQDNEGFDYTLGRTTNALGNIINQTENRYKTNNLAYNINNHLIFQHKFEKIGRTFSVDINSRLRNTDRENYYEDYYLDSITQYLTDENNNTISTTVSYTEPVGRTAQFLASYRFSYNDRTSDKETYLLNPETEEKVFSQELSNKFASGYTTHLPTLTLSNRSFRRFYNFSLSYQNAQLNNQQFYPESGRYKTSFNSLLPSAMARLELKGGANMFIRYNTNTTEPSIEQLQNVIDNSNPLFVSIGNPALDQSYSHSLMMRVMKPNTDKNTSLSNFTRIQATNKYITNATEFAEKDSIYGGGIIVQEGTQVSMPINLDGYWAVNNSTTYGKMISAIKSNLNSTLGLGYVRKPGMTEGQENISNTYTVGLRITLASNISENVDFNTYYRINANTVTNSMESQQNTNSQYVTQTVGGKLNLIFWKGLVFRNDIYFENYNGFSDEFNSNYVLWNISLAKKLFKDQLGELELSVFDLLNQNQSFSQTITPNYIEERTTQVLQQYFMLKFTYQIRKFRNAQRSS